MAMYSALVEEIERQGGNALPVFAKDRAAAAKEFFMENDRAAIDVLMAATGFSFVFGKPEEGVKLFEKLNVPVLAPVYASELDKWQQNSYTRPGAGKRRSPEIWPPSRRRD